MKTDRLVWCVLMGMMLGAASLLFQGCAERQREPDEAGPATWTSLTTSNGVLVACQGCHGSLGNLSLASSNFSGVVGVASTERPDLMLVQPRSRSSSYLYLKMVNDPSIAPNTVMPPSGALSSSSTDEVGAWIDNGAPQ